MKLNGLLATAAALALTAGAASAQTVGFSQIGSESGWRAAETTLTKQQAEERGIDLKFSDAQQKQENQIAAIRSFVAQGVDAILLAPVVATGWDSVLEEAQEAEIPVVLLDLASPDGGDRSAIARGAVARQLAASPPPFMRRPVHAEKYLWRSATMPSCGRSTPGSAITRSPSSRSTAWNRSATGCRPMATSRKTR